MENPTHSLKKNARLAGLFYLIVILTGVYSIFFVTSKIIVQDDVLITTQNILDKEFLFRTGIISDLISNIFYMLLVLALYRLLKPINKNTAKLMLALVIVQIPVVFFMEAFNITSLITVKGEILQSFELGQRQDLSMLFIKINDYGMLALEMFWGLWLLPFGYLVYRSRFIPRIFGILLIIAGTAYMFDSFTAILFPDIRAYVNKPALLLMAVGEISITLWLLIKGIKNNVSVIEKH